MTRTAVALAILLLAVAPALAAPPAPDETLERVGSPPDVGRQVYDAVVLRPLGFLQVVAGAVAFVPAYPLGLLVGAEEDVERACITDPVRRTFHRPLGHL